MLAAGAAHLHKRDGVRRPPAQDAGRLAGCIAQAPVVVLRDGLLQHALGSEVERCCFAASGVDPVDGPLAVRILRSTQTFVVKDSFVVSA